MTDLISSEESDVFRINAGDSVDLSKLETNLDLGYKKKHLEDIREDAWQRISEYQERLYAEGKQSLLVVFQAMDAAGKDSSIRKLTQCVNAQGCLVHNFRSPTKLEARHDFLWRVHQKVPALGEISIFNRSHYEDVLIVRVNEWLSEQTIESRYQHINHFENLLSESGVKIVKFMLHISPEYQLERFKQRLAIPEKNWKFNPRDLKARGQWPDYMSAFEVMLSRCSTERAPWYVVPAENRRFRDALISSVLVQALEEMNPEFPMPEYDSNAYTPDTLV